VWGIGLAGCRFLCAGKYIALLTEHEWGGPQHLAQVSGDPVHDLASTRGHEWLATCVPVHDVMSQGILSSSTTCVEFQSVRRKTCMLPPIGGNF